MKSDRNGRIPYRLSIAGVCMLCVLVPNAGVLADPASATREAAELFERGKVPYRAEDMAAAVEIWSEALKVLERAGVTNQLRGLCHYSIGSALMAMDKPAEALGHHEQAAKTLKATGGPQVLQAACYGNMAKNLNALDRYDEALPQSQQALAMYRKLAGTNRLQAKSHEDIGVALFHMGRPRESIASFDEAMKLYATIAGTELKQAKCHTNSGQALQRLGEHEEAMRRQEQALAIYKTVKGTERKRAICFVDIGAALDSMGKHEEAIQRQEQALGICKTIKGTERTQAASSVNIGIALRNMGKYQEAIQRYEKALATFETIRGTEWEQAACSMNLGEALRWAGKYEEAIQRQEQALTIFRTIEGTEGAQARCSRNIGLVLKSMGKYEEAIQRQEQALAVFKTIKGTKIERTKCLGSIGDAHLAAERFSEAITAYGNARASGSWISRGLGLAYSQRGQAGDEEKAVGHFLEAVRIAERVRSSVLASEHRVGIFAQSSQVFRDFVGLLADLDVRKASLKEPALAQWTVDDKAESVALAAAFHYADQGKGRSLEDALREKSVLKATRADTKLLVEDRKLSLRISKLTSLRESLSGAEAERRKKLTQDIDSLQQRRNMIEVELKKTALGGYMTPDFRKPMEMARELGHDTAVLQYSVGEKEGWLLILTREGITPYKLSAESPALPELLVRQEATLAQLAEAWNERPGKIGLDGLVRLARSRAEDLAKRVAERHNLIDAGREMSILERLAAVVLPDTALAELRKKGIHHLLVIPDGALHYIPFAMLRLKDKKGTHYLVEEFASSYIPAMTTLDTIRKQSQERMKRRTIGRRPLLAFANPAYGTETVPAVPAKDDMVTRVRAFRTGYYKGGGLRLTSLPETEREAIRVASLFAPPRIYAKLSSEDPKGQAVVFTGHGASEEQVKQLLAASDDPKARRQWQYVLFSTHGLADTRNGMLSCLALSTPTANSVEDGFLRAQEVMNLQLDTDMVMLSACQTGLGRLRGGEGLVGLSAAFFYAGAESVCASLWQVPSGPTSQLVPELFKQLKEGKVDRAEALRQAQLRVLRQGRRPDGRPTDYSTPFCWAAFAVMGEYR
jgi:tetratricopeptide (TPR) repeat protein/CHAT domain-containing protein